MKLRLFLSLAALPLLPLSVARAAVNPALVSADAQWLIYADMNALRESVIGKELIALAEKAQVDTGAGKVGVDWQKLLATIGSATAYGTTIAPDPKEFDGTLVVQGTPDLRKIAESLLIQANLAHPTDVIEITDLPFPAYALKAARKETKPEAKDAKEGKAEVSEEKPASKKGLTVEQDVIVAFPPEPILLVSKSRPQLLKARDVFRGTAPSLAKAPSSALKKFLAGSEGAYLFAASVVPAEKYFPADGPQARILKMSSSGSVALGERATDTFAHVELVANSDAMADKLMKIVQGMVAMLSLAETSDKQLADFLNSAAVNREGTTVTVGLAYSSARLAQMIKNLQQQQQSRPQERMAQQLVNGRSLAEWKADASAPAAAGEAPAPLAWRTIENVTLKNGAILTFARSNNGGKNVRFDHIDIIPAEGAGTPLTFRPEFMRVAGPRGNWSQLGFPGADGTYTLKIAYVNDSDGKAMYAVSVRDPRPAPAPETKTP
jgi:hypothetical protein